MMADDFQMAWHDNLHTWPEWGSAPRKPLIVCDMAHQGELLDSIIGPDVATGKPMVYHVLRCELCIAIHVWPLPEPHALARFYAEQFYQVEKPDYVARYERDRAWWEQCVHGPILQQCQVALQLDTDAQVVRFLDVGAGPGIALDVAEQRFGWQTWAIEPNKALCAALSERGHTTYCGTLETLPHGPLIALFDDHPRVHVALLYETLEHQICPDDTLMGVWDLLEPGGIVAVVVPNDYNPWQLAACAKFDLPPYWLAPPQHLFYWTPKTLQLCLRRSGFTIVDMRGTFPLEKFMLEDGRCYVGDDPLGRICHRERIRIEQHAAEYGHWKQLEQDYRENLTQRIGREIVAIARKHA